MSNNVPVVFLAFANDRGEEGDGYLRELPKEERRIRRALEAVESSGWCELVVRTNVTLQEIFDIFQSRRYRHRVAVFHFGGHANSYQLLLESEDASSHWAFSDGLASFLGKQHGLRLVFLNGCSTAQQARDLVKAGVPAAIATYRPIGDAVATEFASRLYGGLGQGQSVSGAYHDGADEMCARYGVPSHALRLQRSDDARADDWPWGLFLGDGDVDASAWQLQSPSQDEGFGLPPVPYRDLPPEPFIRLRWYGMREAEIFFGRGVQLRELHDKVVAEQGPPIILLFGQSGVGKSSLLEAGLRPRLEGSHHVCYARRNQASGLLATLTEALGGVLGAAPPDAWRAIESATDSPVIVVLDQVEEVFTRPSSSEQDELGRFFNAVADMFTKVESLPRGKLVLSFREEWLAEIESHFEDTALSYSRVRIEPLSRTGVIDVITGPTRSKRLRDHFGLTIEPGLPEKIAGDLVSDPGSPVAPTLQVLLSRMWEAAKLAPGRPRFTMDLYLSLQRQGLLLSDFVDQQLSTASTLYPQSVRSGLLLDMLAFHTTALGTADQRTSASLRSEYSHRNDLGALIQVTKDLYLLSDSVAHDSSELPPTRLAHDTLAPLVRQRFDESDRPGQRARRTLESRSAEWQGDQQGPTLDEHDLEIVERGATGMRVWSDAETRLVEASRESRAIRTRGRRALRVLGTVAVALILVSSGFAWWQREQAVSARESAEAEGQRNLVQSLLATSERLISRPEYGGTGGVDLGILLALEAAHLDPSHADRILMRTSLATRYLVAAIRAPNGCSFEPTFAGLSLGENFRFASTKEHLALVRDDCGVEHVLDLEEGRIVSSLGAVIREESDDGSEVATATRPGDTIGFLDGANALLLSRAEYRFEVWDIASSMVTHEWETARFDDAVPHGIRMVQLDEARNLLMIADATRISVHDAVSGNEVWNSGVADALAALSFPRLSPDGWLGYFVTGDAGRVSFHLVEPTQLKERVVEVPELPFPPSPTGPWSVSPDGNWLAFYATTDDSAGAAVVLVSALEESTSRVVHYSWSDQYKHWYEFGPVFSADSQYVAFLNDYCFGIGRLPESHLDPLLVFETPLCDDFVDRPTFLESTQGCYQDPTLLLLSNTSSSGSGGFRRSTIIKVAEDLLQLQSGAVSWSIRDAFQRALRVLEVESSRGVPYYASALGLPAGSLVAFTGGDGYGFLDTASSKSHTWFALSRRGGILESFSASGAYLISIEEGMLHAWNVFSLAGAACALGPVIAGARPGGESAAGIDLVPFRTAAAWPATVAAVDLETHHILHQVAVEEGGQIVGARMQLGPAGNLHAILVVEDSHYLNRPRHLTLREIRFHDTADTPVERDVARIEHYDLGVDVAFSDDGALVGVTTSAEAGAGCDSDVPLLVMRTDSGEAVLADPPSTGSATHIHGARIFSPDNQYIAYATRACNSWDSVLTLRSLRDGEIVLRIDGDASWPFPTRFYFSEEEGHALVLEYGAERRERLELEPTALIARLCAKAGRNLTPTERSTYLAGVRTAAPTCDQFPHVQ